IFPTENGPVIGIHYRPVYVFWLMLNEHLFGSVVPWWHLTSILLHLIAIFLVYRVGIVVLKIPWVAALAALLFAFHPIHVESVAYVCASTDILATVFLLISFLAYFQFREEKKGPGFWLLSVFAAALAILSKENGAMFPWMLVAFELLRKPVDKPEARWKRLLW